MLEAIIGSKKRSQIIKLFFLNDGKKFHIREVARRLEMHVNHSRLELIRLSDAGIFNSERVGNSILYFTNKENPIYNELLGIVKKTAGFELVIKKHLAHVQGIDSAFIFGSYADGNFNSKSDIDLMVIGKPDVMILNNLVNKVENKISREVQYMIYPMDEFKRKRNYGFLKNVMMKKKIFIMGEPKDLDQ
jgi:predicted nucleotidyltransferase